MDKINIAELLKDCPKGMELDCAMFENCTFEGVDDIGYTEILVKTPSGQIRLTKEGCFTHNDKYAKCVIFPKDKTTWEGFQRPFADGDVIYTDNFIVILSNITEIGTVWYHCYYHIHTKRFKAKHDCGVGNINSNEFRLATKEEKEKLFQAIKDNGYKWNAETKTLEKLVEPKFKVGDKVVKKGCISVPILITRVGDTYYWSNTENSTEVLPIADQDDWELVPNKFDVTTLKPFDKVLVRQDDDGKWGINFFGFYNYVERYYYTTGNWIYKQCIPYEGNEHLCGTTDDCDEFYKTWE